jgi:hypothetical protein
MQNHHIQQNSKSIYVGKTLPAATTSDYGLRPVTASPAGVRCIENIIAGKRPDKDEEAILAFVRSKSQPMRRHLAPKKLMGCVDIHDRQTPIEWLQSLSNTQRAYLKEAERFLLWLQRRRQKSLATITWADCFAYRQFIADPQPAAQWCGPRGNLRSSLAWRPFEGPLSANASRVAISILKSLYEFLVEQRYVTANPWLMSQSEAGLPKATPMQIFLEAAGIRRLHP